jgi:hypothetical protein
MASDLINMRVELERDLDTELRKIARTEERSKRHMARLLLKRVVRVWREEPEKLRQLQIIH